VQQRFPYEEMIDRVLTAYAEAAGVELSPRRRAALDAMSWAGGALISR
jgi:hypothetical protein